MRTIEDKLNNEQQSYSRIQLAAKKTIEYINKVIEPGMSLLSIRRVCEEKPIV